MGLTTIIDRGMRRTVSLLDPRPAGEVRQAVVLLRAVDELTGRAVRDPVAVTSTTPGLTGRSAADGTAGLIGVPTRVFPELRTRD
jgi:hypothetical protein